MITYALICFLMVGFGMCLGGSLSDSDRSMGQMHGIVLVAAAIVLLAVNLAWVFLL